MKQKIILKGKKTDIDIFLATLIEVAKDMEIVVILEK